MIDKMLYNTKEYVTPSTHVVMLSPDSAFLLLGSGTNEEYDPSKDYGDEWI